MKCLLDSCSLLWMLYDNPKLSANIRAVLSTTDNEVFASTVSFWEIALKHATGKLPTKGRELEELEEVLFDMRIGIIGLNEQESLSYYRLPPVEGHRDPFDRMLVWQAIKRNLTLLSADTSLQAYTAFGLRLIA
ncbi:MAG: type II toxin-antitoxin system VapC family toxin [Coriobacteriales bacterium]|jgi:PIN domain nuclease of toxin-antitoxin system|nr:type II toxin-antitoxin system VapC family toxin [Coriobacteriales bacterium]